jgi:cytochrome c-type biogenesis protein CcmH
MSVSLGAVGRRCAHRSPALVAAIATLVLFYTSLPVLALSPEAVEQRVQTITDALRCPTCQAISVKDSEAGFSVEIRDKVKRMVEEGQTDDQIKSYFVSRYGEWILRYPSPKGVGLIVWVLPIAALVGAGAAIGWMIVRRGKKAHSGSDRTSAVQPLTPEQRERVTAALKTYEEED